MDMIATYLPWILSAITVYQNLLAGNRDSFAWVLGLVNQLLWLVWIVSTKNWGLIPLNLCLWVVYARNLKKWKQT